MKTKVVIYPYSSETTYFFRYENKEFEIIDALSPKGWGLRGKDVGEIDGGEAIGIVVKDDLNNIDNRYDTVLLVDFYKKLDFNNIIYKQMLKFAKLKKNIICLSFFNEDQYEKLKTLEKKYNIYVKTYNKVTEITEEIDEVDRILKKINTPLVNVIGESERTNKFEIQLSLKEIISKEGYKVTQIGSKQHCEMFGFHSFPSFIYNKELNLEEKIILFNKFVKKLELSEKPDIIIIGVPGSILALDEINTKGFGITNFLVSQAIRPDAVILSTFFKEYNDQYFEEISKLAYYRFGYRISCYNMGSYYFDNQESKIHNKDVYTNITTSFIDKKKKLYSKKDHKIFNILSEEDKESLPMYIIDTLSDQEYIEDIL